MWEMYTVREKIAWRINSLLLFVCWHTDYRLLPICRLARFFDDYSRKGLDRYMTYLKGLRKNG